MINQSAELGNGDLVVLVCSDVPQISDGSDGFIPALCARATPSKVFVVDDLCTGTSDLSAPLKALRARRVVLGCAQMTIRRQEILARLRSAGLHPSGIQFVDLAPAASSQAAVAGEQSLVLLEAALSRLAKADVEAPIHERPAAGTAAVSRRSLLQLAPVPQRPVAYVIGRGESTHWRATVASCPHGAIRFAEGRLRVQASDCTGCGACLTAEPPSVIGLNGWSADGLAAAMSVLVGEVRRGCSATPVGVAITCTQAMGDLPVGGAWLPLEVPSLEMVTAGWLLQIVSAGVGVAVIGCGDETCATRADALKGFVSGLLDRAAPGFSRLIGSPARAVPASGGVADTVAHRAPSIELREPKATVQALAAIVSLGRESHVSDGMPIDVMGAGEAPLGTIESSLTPLGEVTVEQGVCSACECCALACPTDALRASRGGPTMSLTFVSSSCSGCGACVGACPEGAISIRPVLQLETLTRAPRVVATIPVGSTCKSCGHPVAGELVGAVVARRLANSHPRIASRVRDGVLCSDCLMAGKAPTAVEMEVTYGRL